jgi:hypothetical protein
MRKRIVSGVVVLLSVVFVANVAGQEGPSTSVAGGGVLIKGWTLSR